MNKTNLYFICPDINKPSGGIKQIYRQVDVLNNNGFNAYILHEKSNFRCTWFANSTKVVYNQKVFYYLNRNTKSNLTLKKILKSYIKKTILIIKLFTNKNNSTIITANDILVIPEVYGPYIGDVFKGVKKVIYNQGAYQTFFKYNLNLNNLRSPYIEEDLVAVIVNSEDAKNYIELAFPHINVYRIHYGIDKKVFYYKATKKKQIAFMPRRLKNDLLQVINILKFRGALKNWSLIEIDNLPEVEVAKVFRESTFFLSFSINEGFGMPPAEAMATGCVVIGYPGNGGIEYFRDEFSYPIADRNVQQYVKKLEYLLLNYDKIKCELQEKGIKASKFILEEYALEVEEQDIVTVWTKILKNR
ncbi:MAG: glycosyltransferase [Lutibacter sp.]|uniref:glycosyltransferase n=1 Tax=Lutibacter sp. TaxID=1925666 RepID=UPI00385E12CA